MSEAKFKAPKAVMDELNEFRHYNYTIKWLMIGGIDKRSNLQKWLDKQLTCRVAENEIEQAVIDYIIWGKPTIELEREPHYVIEFDDMPGNYHVYFKSDSVFLDVSTYKEEIKHFDYFCGWKKEEAERLNETINGKLVEVK